jgi:hypothetical protein
MTEISRKISTLIVLAAAAALLAGCETDGNSPGPLASLSSPSRPAEPEKPAEEPMTRSRAAADCWMKTEKGSASANLDKRADGVNKCIDEKMKSVAAAPKS